MKLISKILDQLWSRKKPVTPKLPESALLQSDEDIGMLALNAVGKSLNNAKGVFESKVHMLPPSWRFVYVMMRLDGQVHNGGFHQFFTNARGRFDDHLEVDISLLPEKRYREVISRAFAQYQTIDYRDQWDNIGKSWDYFAAPYKEGRFKEEDDAYATLSPSMEEVIGLRVREHWHEYD